MSYHNTLDQLIAKLNELSQRSGALVAKRDAIKHSTRHTEREKREADDKTVMQACAVENQYKGICFAVTALTGWDLNQIHKAQFDLKHGRKS